MPSSAPVLLLPPPSEPLALLVARTIAASMASGEPITRRQLHTLLTDHFGGTDAEGRWSVRDAHIALELAQTEYLQANAQIDLTASAADTDRMVVSSHRSLPIPARITPAAPTVICALTYQSLEVPAPLAPQVGHYLPYRPSRIVIDGAAEHPTPLVESVAMGSIAAPMPEAVPQLPEGLVAKGLLSAAQAETLIYASSAHARDLPGRYEPEDKGCSLKASAEGQVYRQGYFLGDGTGAGKGRQVASVILDRWVRGERRHIWISKNEALLEDARRDWAALGGLARARHGRTRGRRRLTEAPAMKLAARSKSR